MHKLRSMRCKLMRLGAMCVVSSALLDAILYEERHDPLFGLLSEACLPLAIILSSTDSHLAISCP